MGLAADLGYTYRPPNGLQRLMQKFGATKVGAWFFSKTLRYLDRAVHKLSKGRTSTPMLLAGLPVIRVTTTGRKSGAKRMSPLIAPPIGDTIALLGTNFGGEHTPAWVHNLEADPAAVVEYRDVRLAVVARPATAAERDEIWSSAGGMYGGYTKYRERIQGREIRVFVLEPAGDAATDPVA